MISRVGSVILGQCVKPHESTHIVADSTGKISGIFTNNHQTEELPVRGIPQTIQPLEIPLAKRSLRDCRYEYNTVYILVLPKLFGGKPLMDTVRQVKNKVLDHPVAHTVMEIAEPMLTHAALLAPDLGNLMGAFGAIAIRCEQNMITHEKEEAFREQVHTHFETLQNGLRQANADTRTLFSRFTTDMSALIQNDSQRAAVIQGIHTTVNEIKDQIVNQPYDQNRENQLKALGLIISLVSSAIPDQRVAGKVQLLGQAALSFAGAFHAFKAAAALGVAGIGAYIHPIGLALSGIHALFALVNDEGELNDLMQNQLNTLTAQVEELDIRLERIEKSLASFQAETIREFRNLRNQINDLRQLSIRHFQAIDTKLNRIIGYVNAGIGSAAQMQLQDLKAQSEYRRTATGMTQDQHDTFLGGFYAWATRHAKNDLLTGSISPNAHDALVASQGETGKSINALANHAYSNYSLVNPYVWAEAADEYVIVRKHAETDRTITYPRTHLQTFLQIYQAGVDVQNFTRRLQQDTAVFDRALDSISQVDLSIVKALCELAFPQSHHLDMMLSSFLSSTGDAKLRILDATEYERELEQINALTNAKKRDYQRTVLQENNRQNIRFFKEVLAQKARNAQEKNPLIIKMLQKLWDFGATNFPQEATFSQAQFPNNSPTHFTNTSQILPQDIFWAVRMDDIARIAQLRSNVSARDGAQRTPLHIACLQGQEDVVKKLIELGADVNAVDAGGQTPLHVTTSKDIATFLLSKGANPWAINKWGETPSLGSPKVDLQKLKTIFQNKLYNVQTISNFVGSPRVVDDFHSGPLSMTGSKIMLRGNLPQSTFDIRLWDFGSLKPESIPIGTSAVVAPVGHLILRVIAKNEASSQLMIYDPVTKKMLFDIGLDGVPDLNSGFIRDNHLYLSAYSCKFINYKVGNQLLESSLVAINLENGAKVSHTIPRSVYHAVQPMTNNQILFVANDHFIVYDPSTKTTVKRVSLPVTAFGANRPHFKPYLAGSNRVIVPDGNIIKLYDIETERCIKDIRLPHSISHVLTGNTTFTCIDQNDHAWIYDSDGNLIQQTKLDAAFAINLPKIKSGPSNIMSRFALIQDQGLLYLQANGALTLFDFITGQKSILMAPSGKQNIHLKLLPEGFLLTQGDLQTSTISDLTVYRFAT